MGASFRWVRPSSAHVHKPANTFVDIAGPAITLANRIDATVTGNSIRNDGSVRTVTSDAMQTQGYTDGITFNGNTVYWPGGYCINITNAAINTTVSGNSLRGCADGVIISGSVRYPLRWSGTQ